MAAIHNAVFTREGVLFGADTLSQSQLDAMLTEQNGFESTASIKRYLNQGTAYLGKPWSLGASGTSVIEVTDTDQQVVKSEAQIIGPTFLVQPMGLAKLKH